MPDNAAASSTHASADPSAGTGGRPAPEVFDRFMSMTSAAVEATKTDGWKHEDGSAWEPWAADLTFNPQLCPDSKGGQDARDLQLSLKGPVPADPREARDEMRTYLEASGFTLRSVIDPPDGKESNLPYSVAAAGEDGSLIVYAANGVGAFLNLESECSSHPSLEHEVSAVTR
ncbi:hypothetical protein ACWGQ2_12660 [Arthrobacter sp. NPDC055585]